MLKRLPMPKRQSQAEMAYPLIGAIEFAPFDLVFDDLFDKETKQQRHQQADRAGDGSAHTFKRNGCRNREYGSSGRNPEGDGHSQGTEKFFHAGDVRWKSAREARRTRPLL